MFILGLVNRMTGRVAQSVTSLIADSGLVSFIPAQPHALMEIDHEIWSLIQEGLLSVSN